jgi:hypothetical protein
LLLGVNSHLNSHFPVRIGRSPTSTSAIHRRPLPVLAETFIREFSDERAAHERRSLVQLGQGHKLESVGQFLH